MSPASASASASAAADLPWDVAAPFTQRVIVGPEHLDIFKHTNNVVYLSWLEQVAWGHSQSLGLGFDDYRRLGAGCVARRHELDYLAATFEGDALQLATWIAETDGRLTMWRAYQVIRESDRRTVLRGRTQWVCVDMLSGRPRRMPPEFIAAYRPASSQVQPQQARRLAEFRGDQRVLIEALAQVHDPDPV